MAIAKAIELSNSAAAAADRARFFIRELLLKHLSPATAYFVGYGKEGPVHGQAFQTHSEPLRTCGGASGGRPERVLQGNAPQAASFLCPVAHVSDITKREVVTRRAVLPLQRDASPCSRRTANVAILSSWGMTRCRSGLRHGGGGQTCWPGLRQRWRLP